MCKINGHSIFTYMFQSPLFKWKKLYTSKKKSKKKDTELPTNVSNTETAEKTGSLASKETNKRDLSSLKIPLNTPNVGAQIGRPSSVGLNLGGY